MFLTACNNTGTVEITIEWNDKGFELPNKWYAAIGEGATLINPSSISFGDYKEVTPGTTTKVEFDVEVRNYANYTIIVFHDASNSGVYSSDVIN